jgi:hypothetical protein
VSGVRYLFVIGNNWQQLDARIGFDQNQKARLEKGEDARTSHSVPRSSPQPGWPLAPMGRTMGATAY